MDKGRRNSGMLIPTVVMGTLAVILLAIGYFRGEGQHITGIRSALTMVIEILPLLVFAFGRGCRLSGRGFTADRV